MGVARGTPEQLRASVARGTPKGERICSGTAAVGVRWVAFADNPQHREFVTMGRVVGENTPLYLGFSIAVITIVTSYILFFTDNNTVDSVCQEVETGDWCYEGSGGLVVVSYTSVPYPGSAVFGVGMTVSALLLLWVTWNLFWAQDMDIVKQLRKEESTSQVVSCYCFDTTFGKKAVRLNRFQAVMGCVTTLALIVLSIVTMRIHAAVHFDAAIIFFITSSLQFWTNFKLQCTITDTTVWGQISGSSIAPRSLGVKRWIIRSTLVLCAAMLIIFICLVVAGATSFSKRWFAPLCQYIAILVLGASYATYAQDVTISSEENSDPDATPPRAYCDTKVPQSPLPPMPPLVTVSSQHAGVADSESPTDKPPDREVIGQECNHDKQQMHNSDKTMQLSDLDKAVDHADAADVAKASPLRLSQDMERGCAC